MADKKSEYRIPGVTGFTVDGNTVSPDKKGIFHLTEAQAVQIKLLGYNVCRPDVDDDSFERASQPGSRRLRPGEDVHAFPVDPKQTDAKPGKPTPREKVATMTGTGSANINPAAKYSGNAVTIHPDGDNKKKKVVVVSVTDGDDIVSPNLDAKGVAKLLKEWGLTQKQVNKSRDPFSSAAPEPEEDDLVATIHPLPGDNEHFDVVLDDGDGDPEVHTFLTRKQVDKVLKEAGLDFKNRDEVKEAEEPYLAPTE